MLKITTFIQKLLFLLKLRRLVPLNFLTIYNEGNWLTEVETARKRERVKNKCIKGENSPGQTCWILIFSNFNHWSCTVSTACYDCQLVVAFVTPAANQSWWLAMIVCWLSCYSCYTGNESVSCSQIKNSNCMLLKYKNKTNNNNKNKNQWVLNKPTQNKWKQNKHEANKNFRNSHLRSRYLFIMDVYVHSPSESLPTGNKIQNRNRRTVQSKTGLTTHKTLGEGGKSGEH